MSYNQDAPLGRIMRVVYSGNASVEEIEAALAQAKELGAPPSDLSAIEGVLGRYRAAQTRNDIEKPGVDLIREGFKKQAEERMAAAGNLVDAARKVALEAKSIQPDISQLSFKGRLATKARLAELRGTLDGHKGEIFKILGGLIAPEHQGFKDEVNAALGDVENIFAGK